MNLTQHIIESGYAMTNRERDIAGDFFNRGRRDASKLLALVGEIGEFNLGADGLPCNCMVTGVSDFESGYLIIDYISRFGERITNANIPASAFRKAGA